MIARLISQFHYSPGIIASSPEGTLLAFIFTAKAGIYVGLIFLVILVSAAIFLIERAKSNREMHQTEQLNNAFFTKVTHEFRTPLTIILGLSKQLREQNDLSSNSRSYLNAIERQGRYLSDMVNQLLDIANFYVGDKPLEWKTGNLVAFVGMIAESFQLYAIQKEIELVFFSDETEIEVDFIPDHLHKILHNLLSNAIKYSDEGSRVYLTLSRNKKDDKNIIIKVIDHGKGIPEETLPHIFELFYTGSKSNESNGVGLALAKQLVEASGGSLKVKSEEGKGTTFRVDLPVQKNEKLLYPYWSMESNKMQHKEGEGRTAVNSESLFSEPHENDPRATILLVEDNKDVAIFIRSIFRPEQYNILYANNGEKALEIMNNQDLPDIVITDVLMPKKSGIELCKEMKASAQLNHIPVIMISAKDKDVDVIEGLRCGADDYIRKPFQPEELQARVGNLLESRKLLREKFRRSILDREKTEFPNMEHTDFLRQVTDIIYREMKNPEFSSVKLAHELAISVSQMNKKLNAAIGYPSSAYILQVKLDYAKKILSTRDSTIGEVAAECGIFDVNYFSRVFKRHTGITPSQFKRLPRN